MARAISLASENVYKPWCSTAEIKQFSRTLPVEKDNFFNRLKIKLSLFNTLKFVFKNS